MLPADQIVKAVGQEKPVLAALLGLETKKGFIAVDAGFRTSVTGVYAIGDCTRAVGAASTVMAVQDGKMAAVAIHDQLIENAKPQPAAAAEVR